MSPGDLKRIETRLATIEALTDYCRAHVKAPPADLLYRAAGAIDLIRDILKENVS